MELDWVISIFENKKGFSSNRNKTLIHQSEVSHLVGKNLTFITT